MPFLPLFGLILIFVAWFTYERKKHEHDSEKMTRSFWEKDALANSTRRVNLDTIEYIKIPTETLPLGICNDTHIKELEDILTDLSTKRILNLTGMTATDLKMTYGAANLNEVSSYDDNFTLMVQTIYELGEALYKLGYIAEAVSILEFGIVSLTDISGNYKLLCQIYSETNQLSKLDFLKETAEKLDSLTKGTILRHIEEYKVS